MVPPRQACTLPHHTIARRRPSSTAVALSSVRCDAALHRLPLRPRGRVHEWNAAETGVLLVRSLLRNAPLIINGLVCAAGVHIAIGTWGRFREQAEMKIAMRAGKK
jgi:hypothetical protein